MNTPNFIPHKREQFRFYIGLSEQDKTEMLKTLNLKNIDQLYSHIDDSVKFDEKNYKIDDTMEYKNLANHLTSIAAKNKPMTSFIGDGLQNYKVTDVVGPVCDIRGLTTAYTPYQPERSQGTTQTLWIYQCSLAQLTGFEAINASLYDRATALFEAINTAIRLGNSSSKALISSGLFDGDLSVLKTLAAETGVELEYFTLDEKTGTTDIHALKNKLEQNNYACIVFPQINYNGLLEDVDLLTDIASEKKTLSIAVIDPMLLATGALKAPVKYGSKEQGCDMIVAEGQHLAIGPNFGGPGLGIFGIRYNDQVKNNIRATAGRFIGKAKDLFGRECKAIILSTREQHIRREKATSNICSNQAFVATIAGASLLSRGEEGLKHSAASARKNAVQLYQTLLGFNEFTPAFHHAFYNEFVVKFSGDLSKLLAFASQRNIEFGLNVSKRYKDGANYLKLSCSDMQTAEDIKAIGNLLLDFGLKANQKEVTIPQIPTHLTRSEVVNMPTMKNADIIEYYQKLGQQNLSPDEGIYPLGSCTMKYNPQINDWAASLPGFTEVHPQAPEANVQGSLEILYYIQETFKKITGLAGVTTQPVAGAQGELVGLKMFQAYFNDRKEYERNLILIPKSAHGTNPATATMAGYETKMADGHPQGIYLIDANEKGEMNLNQIKEICAKYPNRIAGVMVTNPNTAGVFETQFKEMADIIHSVGGLVYMDGANMNAIAGWIDLNKLGVDAVHNNLHKTWTIPHGGGGPGDAIVAVSQKLIDFLPGKQVRLNNGQYETFHAPKCVGDFHRHLGNFAHKIRAYTYLKALGTLGIREMSATAVLSARYLQEKLKDLTPMLPIGADATPRMHEFIITLREEDFKRIESAGTPKANAIARIGKLFLDFGFHAPTVAFPEVYGLMIEPTESFTKAELDDFCEKIRSIFQTFREYPQVLQTVPHFTPISRVNEVEANKTPLVSEKLKIPLAPILPDRLDVHKIRSMSNSDIMKLIVKAHESEVAGAKA